MTNMLTIPTFQGLTVNGVYKGVRQQHGRPNAQGVVRTTLYCGIAVVRQGNYGTEETIIEMVISEQLIKEGVPAKLAQFEGELISLPFWERLWEGTSTPGLTRYLSNEVKDMFQK